jgi:hypothetical protein
VAAAKVNFDRLLQELQRRGALLEADAVLPSVARMVIGGQYKGSWWAHPLANRIYMLGRELGHRDDVLLVRLISGKMTFVHRRLWPDLYAIAAARESWQFEGLAQPARRLFAEIRERGLIRTDQMTGGRSRKSLGDDARALESRLLILGEEIHSESGAHAKALESWQHWSLRAGFKPPDEDAEAARGRFDQIAAELNSRCGEGKAGRAFMPWKRLK